MEHIAPIVKLNLRPQCENRVYSDTYILAKGTITLAGQEAIEAAIQAERNNKHINNIHYTINK